MTVVMTALDAWRRYTSRTPQADMKASPTLHPLTMTTRRSGVLRFTGSASTAAQH
jgi:hypothetical protein